MENQLKDVEGSNLRILCDGRAIGNDVGVGQCQQEDVDRSNSDPFGLQPISDKFGCLCLQLAKGGIASSCEIFF